MIFNSYEFLFLFLPVAWFGFASLLKHYPRHIAIYLLGISTIFYCLWDWTNLVVLIPSIGLNYALGVFLEKNSSKTGLTIGIMSNIAVLIYYKYSVFLLNAVGITQISPHHSLPLGISFFTFTQITYLVDAYQRKTQSALFSQYALFVTYFPHLISGPLLHHKEMISQFHWKPDPLLNRYDYAIGLCFLIMGLFKKVVLADRLGLIADPIFIQSEVLTMAQAWKGALAYTFQLYFDFSAYSDMAIGVSKLFHINMPINFNSPYKATNIIDFWRRWHMTLSKFLKDYVYIPLGGSRDGLFKKLRNVFIVMLVCGIWHGAGYTFLAWGIWHGVLLVGNHAWRSLMGTKPTPYPWISTALCWTATFLAVVIGWIFFRSTSLTSASHFLSSFFYGAVLPQEFLDAHFRTIMIAMAVACFGPNTQEICAYGESLLHKQSTFWWQWKPNPYWALILSSAATFAMGRMAPLSPFLYWEF